MSLVLHHDCKPGGKMCFLCEQIMTQAYGRRSFLRVIRAMHTARILPGTCLCCGHGEHKPNCRKRDYWGKRCACDEFIVRTARES